jgi:exodeoxyribonuclease X
MLIRVIDLEGTGFEPPEHTICEIGWCDLVSTKLDLAGQPTGWEVRDGGGSALLDPGRPIPAEASAVHHITDQDVVGRMSWVDFAPVILRDDEPEPIAFFAAHNAMYERKFITDDMTGGKPWIDSYKVALRLLPDAVPHSNQVCRYTLKPRGLDRKIADRAHRAYPDAYVTAHNLRDMLELATIEQMIEWTNTPALLARIPFGVHRGKRWSDPDVDDGLLLWTLSKEFSDDVLFTARREIDRREKEYREQNREAHERAALDQHDRAGEYA